MTHRNKNINTKQNKRENIQIRKLLVILIVFQGLKGILFKANILNGLKLLIVFKAKVVLRIVLIIIRAFLEKASLKI
jgi:hypothetical protein